MRRESQRQRRLNSAATHPFDVTDTAIDWEEIGKRWFSELFQKSQHFQAASFEEAFVGPVHNDSLWHPLHTKEGDGIFMFWGPCLQSSISRLSFSFLALFFCYAVSSCVYDHDHPYLVSERLFLAENEAFPYLRQGSKNPGA